MIENSIILKYSNKNINIIWKSINITPINYINLEKLVKKNSKIKNQYINFLKKVSEIKIGNNSFRNKTKVLGKHFLYDYSFLNESSIFQTPEILSFIKILYIKKFFNSKKLKQIEINIDDGYAFDVLKKISKKKNIKFVNYNKKKLNTFNKYYIPWFLRSFLLICNFLFINFSYFNKKKKIKNKNIVLSYINQPKLNNDNLKSFFWGDFEKVFKEILNKDITWVYQDLINKKNKKDFQNLQKENKKVIFLKNFLNFSDIIKSILLFLKFSFKLSILLSVNKKKFFHNFDNSEIYFFNNLKKSLIGFNCFQNILKIIMIKNFVKNIKPNSNIFYLFENQSWEKILNNEISNKKINSYGVLHSLISKWDTRFHKINLTKNYLPTKILINGEYNKKILENFYSNFLKIESIRYIKYLKNKNFNKIPKKSNVIDLYGSFDDIVTENLVKELSKSEYIKKNYYINFFPHPSSNFKNTSNIDLNYNRKKNGFVSLLPSNSSIVIDKLLENNQTIIFNYDNFHDYQKLISNGLIFDNFRDLEFLFKKKFFKKQKLKNNFIYLNKRYNYLKNFLLNIND